MILQNNFNIFDGFVEVTVPLLVEAADYSIIRACLSLSPVPPLVYPGDPLLTCTCDLVVMGNSGNVSTDFTITGSGVAF